MPTIYCDIAGTKFRPIDAQIAAQKLKPGTPLVLEAEPHNPYDDHAVKVYAPYQGSDLFIGYVPKRANNKLVFDWLQDPDRRRQVQVRSTEGGMAIYLDDPAQLEADSRPEPSSFKEDMDDEIPF